MQQLFTTLTQAVEGAVPLALAAAFVWGILSIVLSPCHLASIPLIIGFIGQQGRTSARQAFTLASVFALGILITIALVGAVTASLGRMLGDVGPWGNYFVAAIFFFVGLHLVGVIPLSWSGPSAGRVRGQGLGAALVLGLIFGIALGPCTFAYMAPMLAVAFRVATAAPLYAVALLLVFGIGHCSVIVAAGSSTERVQRYLDWSDSGRGTQILRQVCGLLVLAAGLYMIWLAR